MKRQRRGKEELTPEQRRKFLRIVGVLFCVAFCWVLFAPGAGVVSLAYKKMELHRTEDEFARLRADNEALRTEIAKLREDLKFLEKVARENGFLAKGELVFDFAKQKKED